MRLVGIISWYDEKPKDLVTAVTSIIRAGVDHIVAVDGAYALYPNGTPNSPPDQHEAIMAACRGLNVGCTLHVPSDVFFGNEIEKRTLCFQLAEQITTPDDWYWVMDADQTVTSAIGLRGMLEATDLDVATVKFHDHGTDPISGFPVRDLFRAVRGLHLFQSHCTYKTGDGRFLWSNISTGREPAQEPALDLFPHVAIEHHPNSRTKERNQAKVTYYERRNRLGAETINA